jgi:hypothetical protein
VDEEYFNWLYQKIRPDGIELIPYMTVCALAHRIIFDWSVPNDDNRSADGKELRYEFLEEHGVEPPPDKEWLALDSSIFEMMVALARRCDFIADGGMHTWFDRFMINLGMEQYNDVLFEKSDEGRVKRMLAKLNNRTYRSNGKGGLFPLKYPPRDQREVELWYQMSAYMAENKMY